MLIVLELALEPIPAGKAIQGQLLQKYFDLARREVSRSQVNGCTIPDAV
jgi:hypothetical protein